MEDTINIQEEKRDMMRVKTGIKGLDEFIEGGFPKGSYVVVTGIPGSGKSIFGMQFLVEGMKNNEKCLFITVEQSPDEIVSQAMQFGWNFNQWENEGKLKIVSLDSKKLSEMNTYDELKQLIQDNHYDRVVFDSITSIVYSPISPYSITDGADRGLQPQALMEMSRANVASLFEVTKQHGITTLGISQKVEGMPGDTVDKVSEFKGDGLIILDSGVVGNALNRNIQVKKLRKTKIDGTPHTFDFTNDGISLAP
ncbi:MAG: hypothetical protein KAW45_06455 [Thermoplasmatales archaeon]|nr:hypothetical protein [Thermoplasmatales archaeon]